MKKILFSLLMLCCVTAAWAEGTGDGTKEHPFTGEWTANEIGPRLEAGMYLAFDCVIKDVVLTVTDSKLNQEVSHQWTAWAPGNLINDPQSGPYERYGKDNSPESRQKQTFLLTWVSPSAKTSKSFGIAGYFNGHYLEPDANGFVYVASAAQFWNNLKDKQYAKIGLTQDIYLSDINKDGETFCSTFSGTLDGGGHTIYGDHYGDDSVERRSRTYLFTYSDGATFKNLTFKQIRVDNRDNHNQAIITSQAKNGCVFENITFDKISTYVGDSHDNTGAAAGYADNCTFKNITVKNSDFTANRNQAGTVVGHAENCTFTNIKVEHCESTSHNSYTGGVAGRTDNCTINNVDILNSFIKTEERYVGGVVGYAEGTQFKNCVVDDQSCVCVDPSNSLARAGGIIGFGKNCNIDNCINSALIAANDQYVGGIVGYGTNSVIAGCLNTGMVIAIKKDDVINGFYNKYKTKTGMTCVTKTYQGKEYVIRKYGGDYKSYNDFGGIIGHMDGNNVSKCVNFGSVYSDGTYNGGIVGRLLKGAISDCLSDFSGDKNNLGICVIFNHTISGSSTIINEASFNNCLNLTNYKDIDYYGKIWEGISGTQNYSLTTASDAKYTNKTTADKIESGEICALLGAAWEQNIGTDSYPTPTGSKGVYHSRNITNEYGTAYLPYAMTSDENIRFYTFEDETSDEKGIKLKFNYAENVPARTPVLFRTSVAPTAENPVSITLKDAHGGYEWRDKDNPIYRWSMDGTYKQRTFEGDAAKSIYYVSGGKIRNAQKATIAPYRAYFHGPSIETLNGSNGAPAKAIRFVIEDADGETTALEFVGNDLKPVQNGKTYSIMGTEVGENYRGIVIKNGKKYLIK